MTAKRRSTMSGTTKKLRPCVDDLTWDVSTSVATKAKTSRLDGIRRSGITDHSRVI